MGNNDLSQVVLSPTPLVSVVVCCFNQGHYVAEAIDSVLQQTYSRIETIVVNDGSTDETHQIVSRHSGVKYIHQDNRGLSNARNTGLRNSKGEYIVFLDADDRLLINAVAIGVQNLSMNSYIAFAAGRYRFIDAKGNQIEDAPPPVFRDFTFERLLRGNFIEMHGAVIFRRPSLMAIGGYNEALSAAEDYDLYLRIAQSHSYLVYDCVVAEYRRHDTNMTLDVVRMLENTVATIEGQRAFVEKGAYSKSLISHCILSHRKRYGIALLREVIGISRHGSQKKFRYTVEFLKLLSQIVKSYVYRQ